MARTKIPVEFSSTPGIVDNSSATAITIDSAGAATFSGAVTADGLTTNTAKLKAIAASNTDTAVDVFVYDTRKDSDGGAWRKRTQGTSWYNETLNTATRGARKEFPSVAVIVAEAAKVTIYDGDDPDMPMWMTFPVTNTSWLKHSGSGGCKAVVARDGIMVTGGDIRGSIVRFIADDGNVFEVGYNYEHQYITTRNTTVGPATGSISIVNNLVNDVAMTVLPNAPIDADTGLPVPTIAVATDGGVSVIKDDGSVVDIVSVHTASAGTRAIKLEGDRLYFANQASYLTGGVYDNYMRYVVLDTIPDVDTTYYDYYPSWDMTFIGNNGNLAGNNITAADRTAIGLEVGLSLISEDMIDRDYTMQAIIRHDYNTGWLSGTFSPGVGGSHFVLSDTNTDYITSLATTTLNSTGRLASHTYTDGATTFSLTGDSDSGNAEGYIIIDLNLPLNTGYIISIQSDTAWSNIRTTSLQQTASGTLNFSGQGTTDLRSLTFYNNSDSNLLLYANPAADSTITYTISVHEQITDRSYGHYIMEITGNVTKTAVATGAELIAYSGFSGSNYLEKSHETFMNVSTNVCITHWGKFTSGVTETFWELSKPDTNNLGDGAFLSLIVSGVPRFYVRGSNSGQDWTFVGSLTPSEGWHMYTYIKKGMDLYLYIDDVLSGYLLLQTAYYNEFLSVLRIGNRADGEDTPLTTGSISQFRWSDDVLTLEQIKKMYNDEKHLFQENAKATLYGTSNSITALAYDDDTELLHVGTSAGRSVFQGLRRVDNTTDAVGTAISASNGLVAED